MTKPPNFHDAEPLRTAADELDRVRRLVGPAIVDGRLWVMLVDGDGRQSPVIMPIDDIPWEPDEKTLTGLGSILAGLADDLATDTGPGSVMFTLERHGGKAVDPSDRVWASGLTDACRDSGVRVRGVFVSATNGVRRVA